MGDRVMPGFVKTPKDENKWTRAKEAAVKSKKKDEESFTDQDWALTNHIYHQMDKSKPLETIKKLLQKARSKIDDAEWDPDAEAYGDVGAEGEDLADLTQRDSLDDQEGDAADQWLKQHGRDKNEEASSENERDDGQTDDELSSMQDVQNETKESPSQEGTKAQGKTKEVMPDIDPDRLAALKGVAHHWLNHADQIKKMSSDARSNPHLFAEGHRISAHNAAHEDFNSAYQAFVNSDDYKKMSNVQKMRAEVKFKKDFQEKNPDHAINAANAVAEAHQMHDKAKDLHNKEMDARKAHILMGGAVSDSDISREMAAQHVGGAKDDEGSSQTSMIRDPAAAFAAQYQEQLKGEQAPKVSEADESLQLDSPDKKTAMHPALKDPHNKKLINDFVSDYHPLIVKSVNKARKRASALGVPEDKVDVSALHEAGLHGLMQAVHDYHPESGSTFHAHAGAKMRGLMQSHLSSLDYIPKDTRAKMKAREKGIITSPPVKVETSQPVSAPEVSAPAPVQSTAKDVIASSSHPAATDMADRLKRIVVRKKGQ
jgi:hypothetical protein